MFEQLVPPEIREALRKSSEMRRHIEEVCAWMGIAAARPREFAAQVDEALERAAARNVAVLERYRRREISLREAVDELDRDLAAFRVDASGEQGERVSTPPPSVP